MAGFAALAIGLPAYLGQETMSKTNGRDIDTRLEDELRKKSTLETRILAKAQKARLQVLLDEVKEGRGAERYKAALE